MFWRRCAACSILEYAFPRFLARMVNDPRLLPVVFAIPVLLLLLLMANAGTLRIPDGEIVYRKFIPQWPVVDVLFPLTAIWAVICSAIGVRRLWSGFREGPYGDLFMTGPSETDRSHGLKHSQAQVFPGVRCQPG